MLQKLYQWCTYPELQGYLQLSKEHSSQKTLDFIPASSVEDTSVAGKMPEWLRNTSQLLVTDTIWPCSYPAPVCFSFLNSSLQSYSWASPKL